MDTAAPFGMRPVFHPTGLDRAHRYLNAIPTGYASNIFKYQPVALNSSGQIVVTALSAADYIGVFAGVMFIDAFGKPNFVNNWVASTTLGTGDLWAFVWDDPGIVYEVQANGSIAQTAIGDQANFAASMLTGSTLTGLSTGAIDSTLVGAGVQGMVKIVDIQPRPDNTFGDAFTIVQVQIARHQYVSNKVAI